jgi:adenylyl-sulfate kinase
MPKSEKTKGLVVFFTGLSGSGKSTLSSALTNHLEVNGAKVTLLDGDVIRTHLSSELGFSKEHRSINVRRVGYVTSEIARHGGICVCALIAPYENNRVAAREMVENADGRFIEVAVSTPIEVCETRDPKKLYARARAGEISGFTGISDPYEPPSNPELTIDTSAMSLPDSLSTILRYLTTFAKEHGLKGLQTNEPSVDELERMR